MLTLLGYIFFLVGGVAVASIFYLALIKIELI